jgi:hypothetical protein
MPTAERDPEPEPGLEPRTTTIPFSLADMALSCHFHGSTAAGRQVAGWAVGTTVFAQSRANPASTPTATVLRPGHGHRDCVEPPPDREDRRRVRPRRRPEGRWRRCRSPGRRGAMLSCASWHAGLELEIFRKQVEGYGNGSLLRPGFVRPQGNLSRGLPVREA